MQLALTYEAVNAIESFINEMGVEPENLVEVAPEILEAGLRQSMPTLNPEMAARYVREYRENFPLTPETATALTCQIASLPPEQVGDLSNPQVLFSFMKRWFEGQYQVDQSRAN